MAELPAGYVDGLTPYEGVPTFGGFRHVPWPELSGNDVDVAILGVPYDNSVANRSGCRFGPRALRSQAFTAGFHHLLLGVDINEWLTIVDAGDVHCPHGLTDISHSNARLAAEQVAAHAPFSVFLGGDHSITWPAGEAVAQTYGWGELGMIHFDAHADAATGMDGNLASHATPMRHLLESGALKPGHFEQIGLRGYWPPPEDFEFVASKGGRWHLMEDVRERGIAAVLDETIERMVDNCRAVYLSIDIDILDPGYAPGTGTPEPGGMTPADLLYAVRRIALETPLVALDVMEVAPPYDHADVTINNAHRIVFETLSALAYKKSAAQGGTPHLPGRVPAVVRYPPDRASKRQP
ncbi:agmatinase [Lentzea sp. NPDC058450]|uniref:agmatinase n=1 Tax=Lentzea sp. NPDC058450 TaxID=3346505 RepID=UPI00365B2188